MTATYYPRSWWTDIPSIGHPTPHSQYVGLVVHHTVFIMQDWDSDGILHGDLDDIKRYMLRLKDSRPDLGPDVPYSYVVFRGGSPGHGIVVEGRGPGRTGAHTAGFNSTRYGVAYAGNTSVEDVTDGVIAAYRKVGMRLFDPVHAVRTVGHRDLSATACPGVSLYVCLDELQPPFLPPVEVPEVEDDMPQTTTSRDEWYNNIFIEPWGGTVSRLPAGVYEADDVFRHDGRLASLVWRTWGLTTAEAEGVGLLERRGG